MQKSFNKLLVLIFFTGTVVLLGAIFFIRNTSGLKTELAVLDSIYDSINVRGIVLRKETEIFNESSGILNFLLNDGDKIHKGGVIAEVYKNEQDGLLQKDIKQLNKEIVLLERFDNAKKVLANDSSYIDKQASRHLKDFSQSLLNDDFHTALKSKEPLLNLLNERQAVLGQFDGISDKISTLKSERNSLVSKAPQRCSTILSSNSGYFMGNVDGFENLFDFQNASTLSPEDVNRLFEKKPIDSGAVAKIVNLSYWYFVCNVSKEHAIKFHSGDYVNLLLPFSNMKKLSAKIVAVNQDGKNSDATLVLRCNNIDRDILHLRFEDVRIDIKSYDGLKINKAAIHEGKVLKTLTDENGNQTEVEKTAMGVYVLNGRQLCFKEVELLYVGDTYAICRNCSDDIPTKKVNNLSLYDEIVVDGRDLYNKKIVK